MLLDLFENKIHSPILSVKNIYDVVVEILFILSQFCSRSFSIAIIANDERRFSSVRFLLYVLILFSAEKDLSTDDVVAGTACTSFNNFVASGIV